MKEQNKRTKTILALIAAASLAGMAQGFTLEAGAAYGKGKVNPVVAFSEQIPIGKKFKLTGKVEQEVNKPCAFVANAGYTSGNWLLNASVKESFYLDAPFKPLSFMPGISAGRKVKDLSFLIGMNVFLPTDGKAPGYIANVSPSYKIGNLGIGANVLIPINKASLGAKVNISYKVK
jgi:hypothetical protein